MSRPHFLTPEASANPLVHELTKVARTLGEAGYTDGTVSARYGPRVTLNATGVPLDNLSAGDFVEVADYDTSLDRVVCIGAQPPAQDAGVHQLVYRAKREVMVALQANVGADHPAHERLPRVERGRTPLETAMGVLEALRDADAVSLGKRHVLAVGSTLEEARRAFLRAVGNGESA